MFGGIASDNGASRKVARLVTPPTIVLEVGVFVMLAGLLRLRQPRSASHLLRFRLERRR
jgi:hypothetical protein